jgi:hypothetical protein
MQVTMKIPPTIWQQIRVSLKNYRAGWKMVGKSLPFLYIGGKQ